jgi:hypothetical protein
MATFGAILLCASVLHGTPSADIPVLTVCQALRDPARYRSANVILVGRLTGTSEGRWLDEDCGLDLTIEGRKYATAISTAYFVSEFAPPPKKPRGFRWNKSLLKMALAEVKKTTRLQPGGTWYAVYGRLETETTRIIARSNSWVKTETGYGHLGSAPAQMVADRNCWLKLR